MSGPARTEATRLDRLLRMEDGIPTRWRCVGGRDRCRRRRRGCRQEFYSLPGHEPKECSNCGGNVERVRTAGRLLVETWSNWLAEIGARLGGWDWFVTLTWRDQVHPEAAWKSLRRWLVWVNKQVGLCDVRDPDTEGVPGICGIEWQRRGVIHLHLLLAKMGDAHRFKAMNAWEAQGPPEGFARIFPAADDQCARLAAYIAKYVGKCPDNLRFVGAIDEAFPEVLERRRRAADRSSATFQLTGATGFRDFGASRAAAAREWEAEQRRARVVGAPRMAAMPWGKLQYQARCARKDRRYRPGKRAWDRWKTRGLIQDCEDRRRRSRRWQVRRARRRNRGRRR